MGMVKHYLNNVVCACSDQQFGQDAVQYAIDMGLVTLTGDFDGDVRNIMSQYDDIVEAFQKDVARNEAALAESYGPLLREIERQEEVAEDRWRDRQLFPDREAA
jgi:hypothetical protein